MAGGLGEAAQGLDTPVNGQLLTRNKVYFQATRLFSNSSQKMDLRWADTDLALGVVGSLD